MTRHLPVCPKRSDEATAGSGRRRPPTRVYHLVVSSRYSSPYWLQLEAIADASLDDLDVLLRDTWLECCGHLSAFWLGKRRFTRGAITGPWDDDEPTTIGLGQLLAPGTKLEYEYDFGSTSELTIQVAGERRGRLREPVVIVARNDPPIMECSSCDATATQICTSCLYEDTDLLCDACAAKHACGPEMLLPLVNSPRTGVCAYSGTP
jgi:hypothetical protein